MNKFGFEVVAEIIVAKELILLEIKGQLVLFSLNNGLLILVETDADFALHDEVHLQNLFLLIVYNTFFDHIWKVTRFQTERNIVEELAVFIFLRVEEESEVVKDVIKQVVDQNAAFNWAGEGLDKLVILLHHS